MNQRLYQIPNQGKEKRRESDRAEKMLTFFSFLSFSRENIASALDIGVGLCLCSLCQTQNLETDLVVKRFCSEPSD